MAQAASRDVDRLKKTVSLSFRVDTKGMRRGEQRHMHQGVQSIISAAQIKHVDILNPKSVKITTSSNAGAVGVTLFHTLEDKDEAGNLVPHIVDTDDHVTHADSGSYGTPKVQAKQSTRVRAFGVGDKSATESSPMPVPVAELPEISEPLKFHSVAHGKTVSTSDSLQLNPSEEQRPEHSTMLQRKIGPNWENYGPENVKAGAFQASYMDGEEKHWLVAEKCPFTGTKSAVWNLIAINDGTSALWGGQYNNSKTSKAGLTVHGLPAKKISDAHFKEATRTLSNSLQTLSPFNKGLGVAIQKLDDSPATGDTLVTVELERTPMHPKNGYVAPTRKEILTDDHIVALNGGGRRSGASAAPVVQTAAGFEKYIKGDLTAADILERVKIIPADECTD